MNQQDQHDHLVEQRRPHAKAVWQRQLTRFFHSPRVELTIGLLVVISCILTLVEFSSGERASSFVTITSNALTWLFIVELTLRFLAASSKLRYFRNYWIEIIAVVPFYYVVPDARMLRLLRLVRLLRLFGVVSRLRDHFPYLVRRSVVEYFFVCGLLAFTIIFGTAAMMLFEPDQPTLAKAREGAGSNQGAADGRQGETAEPSDTPAEQGQVADRGKGIKKWFWFNLYSLFAGEPIPEAPRTLGGKLVGVFVMFMGLTIFAMFTGTVSAFMVERLRSERRMLEWEDLHDHVIICGWSGKAEIICREFQAFNTMKGLPIVVVCEWEHEVAPSLPTDLQNIVRFLNDDFTRVAALEKAGVHRARTCIILSDMSGNRSETDADARTILAALTVEKLNPAVYTCAELLNRSYGTHLQMGNVNDFVISGEYGAYLLAQAAMNGGLMSVFSELLTYQRGNEFYRQQIPQSYQGLTYMELFVRLKQEQNAVLIAVYAEDGTIIINPEDRQFVAGDEIVFIAEHGIQ